MGLMYAYIALTEDVLVQKTMELYTAVGLVIPLH